MDTQMNLKLTLTHGHIDEPKTHIDAWTCFILPFFFLLVPFFYHYEPKV